MTVALPAADRARAQAGAGNSTAKRLFDIVLGSILALASVPFIVAFAIGVAISLRTWPFFTHLRPGRDGEPITMIKLRTLPPATPTYADKRDLHLDEMPLPWLCRALRHTHLDELPQLFLSVAGRMSLVGPRPGQLAEVEQFDNAFEAHRTSVRPGCTGLWQIGVGAHGSIAESPEFDLFYLENATVRLDVWILLRTVPWLFGMIGAIELTDIPRWLLARPGSRSVDARAGTGRAATYPAGVDQEFDRLTTTHWAIDPRLPEHHAGPAEPVPALD